MYLSLILSTILVMITLTSKRLLLTFKIILSMITAYGIYKWQHPEMYIINPQLWDNYVGEWFREDFAYVLFLTVISLVFFHWLIRLVIINTINNPLHNILSKLFSKISENKLRIIRVFIVKGLRKIIRWLRKKGIIKQDKNSEPITYDYFSEYSYSVITITIHIVVCWFILGIQIYFSALYLMIIVIAFLIYMLLAVPFARMFFDTIFNAIEHESQLIEKENYTQIYKFP